MTEKYIGSPPRAKRGFAAMSPDRQREIASLGGRAAHQSGHANEFTSEEARRAGRKRHEQGEPPPAGIAGSEHSSKNPEQHESVAG